MTDTDWSMTESEVLSAIGEAIGRDAVVATVVGVEGSAYRRPGAKMLIEADGGAGSLTAGCLEDEVRSLASDVLDAGEPRLETYDLVGDEDALWGLGMGCNGVITVLLEPLTENHRPVVEAVENGEDRGFATVVAGDRPLGEHAVYEPGSGFSGDLPAWVRDELVEATAALVDAGTTETLEVESEMGTVEVFVEGIQAPPDLVVVGSGPDVNPVVELADRVDFRVTVVSFRGALATEENFPAADTVRATSPAAIGDDLALDDETPVVVMSHNFVDDRLALGELLDSPVPYVGLMGPHERFEEMVEAFAEEGVTLDERDRDRVYTPIGLDLGGDSPYRIAYSIVAEALAVVNGRDGGHLAEREGFIHDRRRVEPAE